MPRTQTTNLAADAAKKARLLEQARARQERARARQREKQATPEYREAQLAAAKARQEREWARRSSPEYRAAQQAKQAAKRQPKTATSPRATVSKRQRPKGRTPTAQERRHMDAIGALPCCCCARFGREQPVISLHHTEGRTAPGCHSKVLPLCLYHHQRAAPPEVRARYPDLVPYHADGNLGGPGAWEAIFGPQAAMLAAVWEEVGVTS